MSHITKKFITLSLFFSQLLFSQGFKIETDQGTQFVPNEMISNGRHWSEDQGKVKMKQFSQLWNDNQSWHKRAQAIKENILS